MRDPYLYDDIPVLRNDALKGLTLYGSQYIIAREIL